MRRTRSRQVVPIFLLGLAVVGCGGDSTAPPPPPPPSPAALAIVAGNDQTGVTGVALENRLTVQVTAADGEPLGSITVAWSVESGGGSVESAQTVTDGQGQATNGWTLGPTAGPQSVRASVGTLSATFDATALLADFAPTEDTQITGTLALASVSIPAGVTVTVTGGLALNVAGAVEIAGTLSGDCVEVSVDGAGPLTITGSVSNACSDEEATTRPPLTLRAGEAIVVDGATIESSGDITISNVEAGGAGASALRGGGLAGTGSLSSSSGARGSARQADPCSYTSATLRLSLTQSFGAAGSPEGDPGPTGASVELDCSGDMSFAGSNIRAQNGGTGGVGTSTAPETALGGTGGVSGSVTINSVAGNIDFSLPPNPQLLGGTSIEGMLGGNGGGAGHSGESGVAQGGPAGRVGLVVIRAAGAIRINGFEALVISYPEGAGGVGSLGRGGDALARPPNGADAGTGPAQPGSAASATGGKGSGVGDTGQIKLIGDVLVAPSIEGQENILVGMVLSGPGGSATVSGANGGMGSAEFPDGARGGNGTAIGGEGGDVDLLDNRIGGGGVLLGTAGDGGFARFGVRSFDAPEERGSGGPGFSDCRVGNILPAGNGGRGGELFGRGGLGGYRGPNREGSAGDVIFTGVANGGNGGDGAGPGAGGAAGSDGVVVLAGETRTGTNFEAGADGSPCLVMIDVSVAVLDDPIGHEPFIGATSIEKVTVELGPEGAITITGPSPWITVTGVVNSQGDFTTTGSGTVAGISNVSVNFDGVLRLDGDGRVTGIDGTLVMGANNELPADDDGNRAPAVYSVAGSIP